MNLFQLTFAPVIARWPKIPPMDVQRMEYHCRHLNEYEVSRVCELILDSCRYQPTVPDLIDAASQVKNQRTRMLAAEIPYVPLCSFCNDLGVVSVQSRRGRVDSLMLCDCNDKNDFRAANNKWVLPKWGKELDEYYFRKTCPMEWFKPASEQGSPILGVIQDLAEGWRERIKIAEQFWKQNGVGA